MNSHGALAAARLGRMAIDEPDPVAAGVLVDRIRRVLERQSAPAATVAAMIQTVSNGRREAGLTPARVDAAATEVEHLCGCGKRFFWPAMDPRPRCPSCGARLNEQQHLGL
ncbi:MAG TPA: hypothetical protein DCY40_08735 [Actinobacteria bacterium]|nr:hypothetical protein [Actinomycetota bacterium]